jgi:chaperonin GroEL
MIENITGTELKTKLAQGIKKLNLAVSSTLGPGGRTVLIEDKVNGIKVTKDGVSVAKAFTELKDEVENIGAQLVKQVSIKSANEAGDGTTTSTILATTIVEDGLKLIDQGTNPVEVKKGIDKVVKLVVEELKLQAQDISTEAQIKQVAMISGNGDEEVGNLIATSLEKVGREGLVSIEESKTGETFLEVVEGMQFDRGYKSPYFVTNNTTMQSVLDDPYILIYDGRVNTAQEMVQVLSKANAENKSILLIAEDFGDEALATLIVNKMRGIVKVCAVKAPDFGERRTLLLEDIAILTGGQVISKDKGLKLEKLNAMQLETMLGKARTVAVDKEKTTIIDGKGTEEAIKLRAQEIKDQLDRPGVSPYEKEKLQERLGKLIGGVAIITVGGNSEVEMREKKDRVEDALFATKAALAEGIVPGGGVALINAFNQAVSKTVEWSENERKGVRIIHQACQAPFKKILSNAGIEDWYAILHDIQTAVIPNATYDAKIGKVVDAYETGLLDPAKVTRIALENAASVAGTILTTESVIFTKKEDKKTEQQPDLGMDMGF